MTDQPVYNSVLTSLQAQAWTDMSFFSVRSRHGDPSQPYPDKAVPKPLVAMILVLGLVPTLLSGIGLISTLDRKAFRACTILVLLTAITYTLWFAGQEIWALKTKYLLYLMPPYTVYFVIGLRVVRRWRPALLAHAALLGLLLLLVVAHVYSVYLRRWFCWLASATPAGAVSCARTGVFSGRGAGTSRSRARHRAAPAAIPTAGLGSPALRTHP